MWTYKFIKKETRLQVPTYTHFMMQNHDLFRFWFEDMQEPPEHRVGFLLRMLKYYTQILILFIFVYSFIDP